MRHRGGDGRKFHREDREPDEDHSVRPGLEALGEEARPDDGKERAGQRATKLRAKRAMLEMVRVIGVVTLFAPGARNPTPHLFHTNGKVIE